MLEKFIVSRSGELTCNDCREMLDYIFNEDNTISGLKCSKCDYEWNILPKAAINQDNTDVYELSERCIDVDTAIWDNLGIVCGMSSNPALKTVANSWPEYKMAIEKWLSENNFDKWSEDLIDDLIIELTNANHHSFVCVLLGENYYAS